MSFGRLSVLGVALVPGQVAQAQPVRATPEVIRGEQLYARCAACHALARDRVGPRHCGLLGRRAGSVPGFDYSPAMRQSGIVWDEKMLQRFLANPLGVVPGTRMTYDGVPLEKDRGDLIAYLKASNGGVSCRP